MSNSKLVTYENLSPNHSGKRTHAKDRITPHCVVGYLTAPGICGCFLSPAVKASCNYAIGKTGDYGLSVPEDYRSWCTSSNENDQRAVTIECASGSTYPYTIPEATIKSLIKLMADICRRNGKKKLLWFGDKAKTLAYEPKSDEMVVTAHRWFAAKECPGADMYGRMTEIVAEVNKLLGSEVEIEAPEIVEPEWYRTRKVWSDPKTQYNAYTNLDVAIKNCPAGYTVYDCHGEAIYTNVEKGTTYFGNTDKIWMGWTKRETGSEGLRCIHGDTGKAYGLQFDYRYGLIPFLKYCVEYNAERYAGFKPYIALGAGNSKLIYNKGLGKLWQTLYDSYTAEFEQLQYTCAYQQYYLPAKEYCLKNYGLDMDKCHPAIKGTLWSMSFRSGTQTGAQKFAGCAGKSDEAILNAVYPKYGNNDRGRWTRAGQWGDALTALKNDTYASVYKEMQKSDTGDKTGSGKITKISEWIQTIKDWEQKMIEAGAIYSNKNNKTDYEVALKQKPVLTNCALFVTHALQVAGIFGKKDKFYGSKGTLIKGSAASKMGTISNITTYDKATVTADKANIPVGAIVTWHEGHTNVYLGKNDKGQMTWSDAGRGTTIKCAENSGWKSFRKTGNMSGFHVANVIQLNLIDDAAKKDTQQEDMPTIDGMTYIVQAGAYAEEANANKQAAALKKKGFDAIVKKRTCDWFVQCGAFKDKKNADALIKKLKQAGFSAILHL